MFVFVCRYTWMCVCSGKSACRYPKRTSDPLDHQTWIWNYRKLWTTWYRCQEPNLGPLKEQQIPWASETCPAPPHVISMLSPLHAFGGLSRQAPECPGGQFQMLPGAVEGPGKETLDVSPWGMPRRGWTVPNQNQSLQESHILVIFQDDSDWVLKHVFQKRMG